MPKVYIVLANIQLGTGAIDHRLEPLKYSTMNQLHPGRYGGGDEPWVQRKHFFGHNLSQLPIPGNINEMYKSNINYSNPSDYNSISTFTQNKQIYSTKSHGLPQDALKRSELTLDKKYHPIDQQQSYLNYMKQANPSRVQQDEEYLQYKQEQDRLMYERFQQYKRQKQQEEMNNNYKIQQISQTTPRQLSNQQIQTSNQDILDSIKEQIPQQYQNKYSEYQQLPSQKYQNMNLDMRNSLPPLNYKQKYRLNDSLYNSKLGYTENIHQNYSSYFDNKRGNQVNNEQRKKWENPAIMQKQNNMQLYEQQRLNEQIYKQELEEQQKNNFDQEQNEYQLNQLRQLQQDKYQQDKAENNNQLDILNQQQDQQQYQQQLQQQQQQQQQQQYQQQQQQILNENNYNNEDEIVQQEQQPVSYMRPFRVNPTVLSYNGVPYKKY